MTTLPPSDPAGASEARIRDLERRLAALETNSGLRQASLTDGRIAIVDEDGYEQVVFGRFREPGPSNVYDGPFVEPPTYGVAVIADEGATTSAYMGTDGVAFLDGDDRAVFGLTSTAGGLYAPCWSTPWERQDTRGVNVTSGSFVTTHAIATTRLFHDTIVSSVYVDTPAGVTGEVRVREVYTGNSTSTLSISAGSAATHDLNWLHGCSLNFGFRTFVVEARRTGGASPMLVYPAMNLAFESSLQFPSATSDGWI